MKPGTWPRLLGAGLVVSGAYDLIEEVALIVNQPALLERAGTTFWVNYGIVIVLNMALIWAGFAMVSRRPSRRRAVTIIFALGALHQTYTLVTSWVNVWSHRGINIPAFLIAVTWLVIWWGALAYMIVTWRRPEFQRRLNVPAAQPEPPEHHRVVAAKITDGPNWHEQLLASLHETGTQPTPRPRRWPLILAFIGILIGARLLAEGINLGMAGANPQWLAFIWLILAFGLTLAVGLPLAAVRRRLAQARARSAEDALKRAGAKRPIFYLRSFALDDEVGRPSVLELLLNLQPANPEQAMTRVIARCGPVIAIGRPGEGLPALGAARFYVDHSLWQEKVADVATVAQAVVWASGTTVGLQWEITHLVRSLPPEKLILWAHPWLLDLDPDEREVQWAAFVDGLGGLFPKPLPKPLGNTRFFAFDKDFTPIPFAAHRPTREGSLLHSMRDLLASKGIAPYDPVHLARIRRRRRIALGLFGAFVAAIVLGAAYLFVDYVRPKAPTVYNWNILAENLVHDESFASPANADEVLRRLQGTVDALDGHWFGPNWENTEPGRLPPLKVMAQHYLAAFRAAHADPQIELVFSLKRTALAIDAKTPADAKAMSQRLVAVRAALTNADNDWVAIKSETSGAFYCDKIRSLLETREKLFEAEGALLDFLANNPTGWSSQMLLTGAPRLLFNTPELLTQAQKLAAQRDAAAQALITAYGKD